MSSRKQWAPPAMRSVEDTGLNFGSLSDLAIKTIYFAGVMSGAKLAEAMCLPYTGVVNKILEFMRKEKWIEVRTSSTINEAAYEYIISGKGSSKAQEVLQRSMYAGPCPVTLPQYVYAMKAQYKRPIVQREGLLQAFDGLVVDEDILGKIGPAMNSGKAIFMHGPPGNGKTTFATRAARHILGEDLWLPYAVDVDGQVIRIFDNVNHEVIGTVEELEQSAGTGVRRDPRWIKIKRPVIMVGGELTMAGLDLVYDPINKFYEAPFQMKANGGMFFIDDFGRQTMRPQDLLNRWIVPLESRIDFLTLNTGRKIEVPFNVLIIFSTNLPPADLVDEAFLRRIPYKIEVGDPTFDQYREIFKNTCQAKRIPYDEKGLAYLLQEWYLKRNRPLRSVHPRDILDQLLDIARYLNRPPQLTKELLDRAADAYFVDLTGEYKYVATGS
jgi:DNA polymerase III delta prime subunit